MLPFNKINMFVEHIVVPMNDSPNFMKNERLLLSQLNPNQMKL